MWVPVCLLGVISGYILFVGFNLTSEKYPNGGCPKILLRIFSYQVNEYFTPMDDEMVAELCKKPIAQPTEDTLIKDESTEKFAAARLRIPNRQSTDKSTDAVELAGQSSEKELYLTELAKDVENIDEQKTKQIEKIQDTPGCCRHHLTAPCGTIVEPAEEFIAKILHNPEESETKEIIDESSSDRYALVKEIFRYTHEMFTPYVSPFLYLSNFTHKPAVIVQDLIIKPDFNDIISSSLMFPPYINPVLFTHLTAIDYLTTDETIECRQVVDGTTKSKQASENLQHSSDGKIIKRKGLFSSEDVSDSSEDVSDSSEDVSDSSEDVSDSSEDVSDSSEDGPASTEDGSSTTEDGSSTTEDGSSTTEDGSSTTEEKCFGISSKLCNFGLSEHFIPLKKTRIPEYCEALYDYYDCHFENRLSPKSLCGKEFNLQIAHDLMTKLCTESILKYTKTVRCAKTAVQEDFEHCKIESEIFVEKLKIYKGTEVFENDESFESCIKSVFRNECFLVAIEKKCVTGDFLSYGDLLSRSGAQFHCKNQEEYSRALEVARSV